MSALALSPVSPLPFDPFLRTTEGAESVRRLAELAAERGLMLDLHCDESDDPLSRHVETLAFHTQRLGLQGRVNAGFRAGMIPGQVKSGAC